ncbi:hypothetical protein BT67DRAFT_354728, partial [Trichocladium antarcticum]
MGWFWQAAPSSPKPEGSSDTKPAPATAHPPPPPPPATTPQQPTPTESAAAAAAAADRETALFLSMLMKETGATADESRQPAQTSPPPPPPPPPSASPSWNPFRKAAPEEPQQPPPSATTTTPASPTRTPQSLAMSEHLLPTTMSCRDAFDYAWHCHTPGSQVNAVYRYGSVRPCTELWDDFWFCMRTKRFETPMREAAIREHYRAKEAAKYGAGRPSSEDVWESRDDKVPPGTAFQAEFEAPVLDDAEFQRADAERRRLIRE